MGEDILQPEPVETAEQTIAQGEEVETMIDADELETLRQRAAELEELETKIAFDKQRDEILSYASKSNVRGFDKLYEFLDHSKLETEEGKQSLFELLASPELFSRSVSINRPTIGMPTNGGPQNDRSADALLAEAAAKARATGRHEDMVAYTRLKRELKK